MENRLNEKNFFKLTRGEYVEQHRESEIALKVYGMLDSIARAVVAAGGGSTMQYWAEKPLIELLITAARNNIDISAVYSRPEKESTGAERPSLSPPIKQTNGYCDSCGDMYVKGYERCHPNCQKDDPPVDTGYTEVMGR